MDGVLVNYQEHYQRYKNLNFDAMEPIEGSIDAFHELNKDHDVYIVSAPPLKHDNAYNQKIEWIKRNLGSQFEERVIFTRNKSLLRGDYLIDDNTTKHGIDGFETQKDQVLIHFNPERSPLEEWVKIIIKINND